MSEPGTPPCPPSSAIIPKECNCVCVKCRNSLFRHCGIREKGCYL